MIVLLRSNWFVKNHPLRPTIRFKAFFFFIFYKISTAFFIKQVIYIFLNNQKCYISEIFLYKYNLIQIREKRISTLRIYQYRIFHHTVIENYLRC